MRNHLVRAGSSVFGAMLLVLALALPALADDVPSIQPDGSIIVVGEEVTVTGDGFAAGEQVDILVGSGSCEAVVVGTVTADETGAIEGTFTMPAEIGDCKVNPGPWQIIAITDESGVGAEYDVLVGAPGTGGAGGGETQPATDTAPTSVAGGSSTTALLLVVGLLAAMAAGLVALPARRRR